MPKLIDTIKTYKTRILVVLGAIAALAVAISGNQTATSVCQGWSNCRDAYAAGTDPAVSPTTPPATPAAQTPSPTAE